MNMIILCSILFGGISGLEKKKNIYLDSPKKIGNKIIINFHVPEEIRKFFCSESFFVEYDQNININNIPDSH